MSEKQYILKKPFEYAGGADMQEAGFITMLPPTFKQLDKIAPIKQAFMSAITELSESVDTEGAESGSDDSEIKGGQVIAILYRWSGDMAKVLLHAEQLFKSGAALVDGEQKLTTPLMEKMDLTDFEGLLGDYIANFIAPSLMDGM